MGGGGKGGHHGHHRGGGGHRGGHGHGHHRHGGHHGHGHGHHGHGHGHHHHHHRGFAHGGFHHHRHHAHYARHRLVFGRLRRGGYGGASCGALAYERYWAARRRARRAGGPPARAVAPAGQGASSAEEWPEEGDPDFSEDDYSCTWRARGARGARKRSTPLPPLRSPLPSGLLTPPLPVP